MKTNLRLLGIMFVVLAISGTAAYADTIDFEGYASLTPLGVVPTATNAVTFSVTDGGPAYVADIGPPQSAFVPVDTPAGGVGGTRFLTDETTGPRLALDYFMTFAVPVLNLSLDLYDFRQDGYAATNDTATLTVYSDLFTTPVGDAVFTIPSTTLVDGNVENLAVLSPTGPISSASVTFSTASGLGDIGTGIDNITFSTVPEPTSLLLLGTGLGVLGLAAYRRRKK